MVKAMSSKILSILHICNLVEDIANGLFQAIPGHIKEQLKYANVALINLEDYRFSIGNALSFSNKDIQKYSFTRLIEQIGNPDIVIFHGIYSIKMLFLWWRYVKNTTPYIFVPHGSLTQCAQNKGRYKKILFNFLIVNAFCRNALAIQFLSEGEKKSSRRFIYNNKYIICPNGINMPKISKLHRVSELHGKNKKEQNSINIVFIGRYDIFYKGLDLLLEAIYLEKEKLIASHVSVTLYGDKHKNNYDDVEAMVKSYKISDIVTCNGIIFGTEKERVLLDCDYFIQTSRSEGLPGGLIEAMSYGIPVLITKGTNLTDVVTKYKNGYIAETSVEGIRKLLNFVIDKDYDSYKEMVRMSIKAAITYELMINLLYLIFLFQRIVS